METLQKEIQYQFTRLELLRTALTHPSLAYETKKKVEDNQRMEFLGDAVIEIVVTRRLYEAYPDSKEGQLTKLRARLVSSKALARAAERIDLGSYLLLGKGENANGGRRRQSNLADAFEALIGAIYLDSGIEKAFEIVNRLFEEDYARVDLEPVERNPKGELQEILQEIKPQSPLYAVSQDSGPDHQRIFYAMVEWDKIELGKGFGSSKKAAQIAAASDALEKRFWEKSRQGSDSF